MSYILGEHPECLYCKRIFVNTNALIDHLLMTRRNRDSGIVISMGASFAPLTSKIVMRTINVINARRTLLPDMPNNRPFNPNFINLIGLYLGESEFSEDKTFKAEPEEDRSLLIEISGMQPFNPNLFPKLQTDLLHYQAVNEFGEGEIVEIEAECDRSTLTPNMSNMSPFD